MINEMDLLRMDERQRSAWLLANRATVIAVGMAWLGMIVWELAHERAPIFLIVMVPVFALFRVALYLCYLRMTPSATRVGFASRAIRFAAALLLAASVFIPLFSTTNGSVTAWRMAGDDWDSVVLIALAFLWPWGVMLLGRFNRQRWFTIVVQFVAPLLAALSTLIILWIPQLVFEFDTTFAPWLWIPAEVRVETGLLLAVGANGLYVAGWLVGLLGAARTGTASQP